MLAGRNESTEELRVLVAPPLATDNLDQMMSSPPVLLLEELRWKPRGLKRFPRWTSAVTTDLRLREPPPAPPLMTGCRHGDGVNRPQQAAESAAEDQRIRRRRDGRTRWTPRTSAGRRGTCWFNISAWSCGRGAVMAEGAEAEPLLAAFRRFSLYGDPKASGKELSGKAWAKLCKDCRIADGKNLSAADADIVFSKVRQRAARVITYQEFQRALEELAPRRFKGQSQEEALRFIHGLVEGREPAHVSVTKVAKTAAVDRLTDTSRYTGSHKERFDDSGRGKGREGREEVVENTGYVSAYKNSGSYDSKAKPDK